MPRRDARDEARVAVEQQALTVRVAQVVPVRLSDQCRKCLGGCRPTDIECLAALEEEERTQRQRFPRLVERPVEQRREGIRGNASVEEFAGLPAKAKPEWMWYRR